MRLMWRDINLVGKEGTVGGIDIQDSRCQERSCDIESGMQMGHDKNKLN